MDFESILNESKNAMYLHDACCMLEGAETAQIGISSWRSDTLVPMLFENPQAIEKLKEAMELERDFHKTRILAAMIKDNCEPTGNIPH